MTAKRCHLTREPGDRKVVCGQLAADVPVCWSRSMGAHESGHAFSGRPLPDWCNDCVLGLMEAADNLKRAETHA